MLAENLASEGNLELGNRGFFAEPVAACLRAWPDAPVATHIAFCPPIVDGGPLVQAIRARLRAPADAATALPLQRARR